MQKFSIGICYNLHNRFIGWELYHTISTLQFRFNFRRSNLGNKLPERKFCMSKDPSQTTMLKVYKRWKGKCAFCGVGGTIEEHHIVPKSEDYLLIDDPENLILLCANHHALTLKKKPNGLPVISFQEINDVVNSRYVNSRKLGVYFDAPKNGRVILGSNSCMGYPYILVVNKKPLIELWIKKPVYYTDGLGWFLTMRFFDEENNFLAGVFDNHWASVIGEDWAINITEEIIEMKHKNEGLFIRLEKKENLYITGTFYFDGIQIEAKENELTLSGNKKLIHNSLVGCAFSVFGDKHESGFSIGGVRL